MSLCRAFRPVARRKYLSFWPSELPLRERNLERGEGGGGGYGSGGMVPQKIFDNFIPKIAGNAPKFYN